MLLRASDIVDRHAYTRIEGDALVRLAELAGAPWSDEDSGAQLGEEQKSILRRTERAIIIEAGSRGGKSVLSACFGLSELLQPNRSVAIVGARADHAKKEFGYICQGMRNLFGSKLNDVCPIFKNVYYGHNYSMSIETIWGSICEGFTLARDEGARALGAEFDMIILAEGSRIDPAIYYNKLVRALGGRAKARKKGGHIRRTGRTIGMSSPNELEGATYAIVQAAKKQTKNDIEKLQAETCDSWLDSLYYKRMSVIDLNPAYPPEVYDAEVRRLIAAGRKKDVDEQFLGIARARTGLIYSKFNDDLVVPLPDTNAIKAMNIGIGIDTGHHFAAVLCGVDTNSDSWCLGEYYDVGCTIREGVQGIKRMYEDVLRKKFEREDLVEIIVDRASQHKRELQEAGLNVDFHPQNLNLEITCDQVNQRFATRSLWISDTCTETISDLEGYQVMAKLTGGSHANKKLYAKGRNHLLDALRYILLRLWEMPPPREEEKLLSPVDTNKIALQNKIREMTDWRTSARRHQQMQIAKMFGDF